MNEWHACMHVWVCMYDTDLSRARLSTDSVSVVCMHVCMYTCLCVCVCVCVHSERLFRESVASLMHARMLYVSDLCTGPRFITGGTNSGIMKFVGEARAKYNPTAPLIGISALGAVAGGAQLRRMARASPGESFEDEDAGKQFRWNDKAEAWQSSKKMMKAGLSSRDVDDCEEQEEELTYDDLVHLSKTRQFQDKDVIELDCNHSHFLLVDNNVHGDKKLDGEPAFGCERKLRAHFETCVAGSQGDNYPVYCLQNFGQENQWLNGQRVLSVTVLGAISALQAIKIWEKGVGVKGDVILDHHPADLPMLGEGFAAPIPVGMPILNDKEWKYNEYWCDIVSGLKWKKVGVTKPKGRDLDNSKLAKALTPQARPSGLLWEKIGSKKPSWVDSSALHPPLMNSELAMALTSQTKFTQEEWDKFGIKDLRQDCYIESDGAYFLPHLEHKLVFSQDEWASFGIKDLRITDFIQSGAFYFQPADVEVCSALQAIWLHAGNGPADERLQAVCKTATELNKKFKKLDKKHVAKKLDEALEEIYKKQQEVKWQNVGNTKPDDGRRLENLELAAALTRKTEFTEEEWKAFHITDVRLKDFIKSNDSYFVCRKTASNNLIRKDSVGSNLIRKDSVGSRGGKVRDSRGGWDPLAKEKSLKLFIQSMKDTGEDSSAEEILDVHSLTMPSEFSYIMPDSAKMDEVIPEICESIEKWFRTYTDTEGKMRDKDREIFINQKAALAKDCKISESLAANLFAQRLDHWRREEREVLVTLRVVDEVTKGFTTKTVSCKIKNLSRLSSREVQARLLDELGGYTWKQSSRTHEDDEDEQTGQHDNGPEPMVPLVSITVQGGKGSGKNPQKTSIGHFNRVFLTCLSCD